VAAAVGEFKASKAINQARNPKLKNMMIGGSFWLSGVVVEQRKECV